MGKDFRNKLWRILESDEAVDEVVDKEPNDVDEEDKLEVLTQKLDEILNKLEEVLKLEQTKDESEEITEEETTEEETTEEETDDENEKESVQEMRQRIREKLRKKMLREALEHALFEAKMKKKWTDFEKKVEKVNTIKENLDDEELEDIVRKLKNEIKKRLRRR